MNQSINKLRIKIDKIDQKLIILLAERFKVTKKIGIYKRNNNINPIDPNREQIQFNKITLLAKEYNLDPKLAKKILRIIIDEVVLNHKELQNGDNDE